MDFFESVFGFCCGDSCVWIQGHTSLSVALHRWIGLRYDIGGVLHLYVFAESVTCDRSCLLSSAISFNTCVGCETHRGGAVAGGASLAYDYRRTFADL